MAERALIRMLTPDARILEHDDPPPQVVTREHCVLSARNVAGHYGYAIAVHGTLARDIDLVAVPWIEDVRCTPFQLAQIIAYSLPGRINGDVTNKPHGRRAWAIHPFNTFGQDHFYIDLSVMPTRRQRKATENGGRAR